MSSTTTDSTPAGGTPEDRALRTLLTEWTPPPPSAGFVETTLLRIELDRHVIPEPPVGYVDRVMAAIAADRAPSRSGGTIQLAPEVAAPEVAAPEIQAGWRRPTVLAVALAAALVLFAVLPFVRNRGDQRPMDAFARAATVDDLVDPGRYPMLGSNAFTRAVALVRAERIDDHGENGGLWLPAAPPLAVDAGLVDAELVDAPWDDGPSDNSPWDDSAGDRAPREGR